MKQLAIVIAVAACGRRAPIASCEDDLRGVYAAGQERWMVLDHRATLEAYPLFPDGATSGGSAALVTAPRVIDLARTASGAPGARDEHRAIDGILRRRYMHGAAICQAEVAVRVARCAADSLELMVADPAPPIGFSPCTWPAPSALRVVRWQRQ